MTAALPQREPKLGTWLTVSTVAHLLLAWGLASLQLTPLSETSAPVYYVDVVNLPVASPQAGTPAVAPSPPLAPPAPIAPKEMRLPTPAPATAKKQEAARPPQPAAAASEARAFEERLAKLSDQADARHQAAALEALQKRTAPGRPPAGMPGGTGNQAGSEYAAYLQSRLHDAFKLISPPTGKKVEVVVRLTIGSKGQIVRQRIERTAADRAFMDAVQLAIETAGKNFPPPPGGREFEHGFIFRPLGVRTQ
jgi:colicin import membrane protein